MALRVFPRLAVQGAAAQAPTAPLPLQAAAQAEVIKKKESAAAVASAAAGAVAAAAASLAKTKEKAGEATAAATARTATQKAAAAKPYKAAVGPEAAAAVEEIFEYSHGTGTSEEARDELPRDTAKTKEPPARAAGNKRPTKAKGVARAGAAVAIQQPAKAKT